MAYINPLKGGTVLPKTKYVNPFIGGEVAAQVQVNNTFAGTKEMISGLLSDPISLKADPTKAIANAWNSIKKSVVQESTNIKNLFESKSISEGIGHGLESVAGGVGVVFSPLTALFTGAEQVPVLGSVAKIINTAFSALGEGGAGITGGIVDQLPVSQEIKDNLRPGVEQIGALVAQVVAGKLAHSVLKTAKVDPLKSKNPVIKDLFKKNPTQAKEIIDLADQVLERQKAEVIETKPVESTEIKTESIKPLESKLKTEPIDTPTLEARKYPTAEEFVKAPDFVFDSNGKQIRKGDTVTIQTLVGDRKAKVVDFRPNPYDKDFSGEWRQYHPDVKVKLLEDIQIGSQPKISKGKTLWHSTDYVNQNEFESVEKDVFNNPAKDIKWREDLIDYFNKNLKTKSQLTDIWNKANKSIDTTDPRNFKTAEEFVKAQGHLFITELIKQYPN